MRCMIGLFLAYNQLQESSFDRAHAFMGAVLAEDEGFEPSCAGYAPTAFEAGPFNRAPAIFLVFVCPTHDLMVG